MDDFATRLKRFMFLKGVRQVDIAERTGINKGNISRWMRGENVPYGENLYKLAKALGVTVDESPMLHTQKPHSYAVFLMLGETLAKLYKKRGRFPALI